MNRTPLSNRSSKKASRDREYTKVRKHFLIMHPKCGASVVGCSKRATEIHHVRGRIGRLQCDTRFFMAICRKCHDWIGDNGKKARAIGLLAPAWEFNVFPVDDPNVS